MGQACVGRVRQALGLGLLLAGCSASRIENGTFGRCERCGKPIEEERLNAIPHATLCIEDKRRDERG